MRIRAMFPTKEDYDLGVAAVKKKDIPLIKYPEGDGFIMRVDSWEQDHWNVVLRLLAYYDATLIQESPKRRQVNEESGKLAEAKEGGE